jgi:phosphoglycolate phosphatase
VKPPTTLLVFDLDGTLIDSRRDLAESANLLIEYYGGRPLDEAEVGRMVGDGAAVLVRRALDAAGIQPSPIDAVSRFVTFYAQRLVKHTLPYPGMLAALAELRSRGPLAVLTNKPTAPTRRILDELGMTSFFGYILGGDGSLPRKPAPEGLRHLARLHGVLPDATVLIGDSIIDWETAGRAGTAICLARYGFGFEGFPVERLTGRELFVDSPTELPTVLKMHLKAVEGT